MYFFSVLGVVLVSWFLLFTTSGGSGLIYFLDFPSALTILLFDVTLLFSAGLLKDFNNALRLAVRSRREREGGVSAGEISRAIEAVCLARRVSLAGGAFSFLFSVVLILANMDDPLLLGPMLAVALLTPLYALAIALVLLPLEAKLRVRLREVTEE